MVWYHTFWSRTCQETSLEQDVLSMVVLLVYCETAYPLILNFHLIVLKTWLFARCTMNCDSQLAEGCQIFCKPIIKSFCTISANWHSFLLKWHEIKVCTIILERNFSSIQRLPSPEWASTGRKRRFLISAAIMCHKLLLQRSAVSTGSYQLAQLVVDTH